MVANTLVYINLVLKIAFFVAMNNIKLGGFIITRTKITELYHC